MELLGTYDRTWGLKTLNYALKMTWGGQNNPTDRLGSIQFGWVKWSVSNRIGCGLLPIGWAKVINSKVVDLSLSFPWPLESTKSEFVCSSYGQNFEGVSGTTSLPLILRSSFFSSFLFSFFLLYFILESLEWQLHDFYLLEHTPRDFHLSGIPPYIHKSSFLIIFTSFPSFSFHEPKIENILH